MNNSINCNNSQHLHNIYFVLDIVFRGLRALVIHSIHMSHERVTVNVSTSQTRQLRSGDMNTGAQEVTSK